MDETRHQYLVAIPTDASQRRTLRGVKDFVYNLEKIRTIRKKLRLNFGETLVPATDGYDDVEYFAVDLTPDEYANLQDELAGVGVIYDSFTEVPKNEKNPLNSTSTGSAQLNNDNNSNVSTKLIASDFTVKSDEITSVRDPDHRHLDVADGHVDGFRTVLPPADDNDVLIVIFDTGIAAHSLLEPVLDRENSFNFTSGKRVLGGIGDKYGHGTHVADTARHFAPDIKIASAKVLNDRGIGNLQNIIAAIRYYRDWAVKNNKRVVLNMSLSGPRNEAVNTEIANAVATGKVIVVAAAGNQSGDACNATPASAPDAITVGATNRDNTGKLKISNSGACVDLYASGDLVLAADPDSKTAEIMMSGSSMSTGQVSGRVAYLWSKNPSLTNKQVEAKFKAESRLFKEQAYNQKNQPLLGRCDDPGIPADALILSLPQVAQSQVVSNDYDLPFTSQELSFEEAVKDKTLKAKINFNVDINPEKIMRFRTATEQVDRSSYSWRSEPSTCKDSAAKTYDWKYEFYPRHNKAVILSSIDGSLDALDGKMGNATELTRAQVTKITESKGKFWFTLNKNKHRVEFKLGSGEDYDANLIFADVININTDNHPNPDSITAGLRAVQFFQQDSQTATVNHVAVGGSLSTPNPTRDPTWKSTGSPSTKSPSNKPTNVPTLDPTWKSTGSPSIAVPSQQPTRRKKKTKSPSVPTRRPTWPPRVTGVPTIEELTLTPTFLQTDLSPTGSPSYLHLKPKEADTNNDVDVFLQVTAGMIVMIVIFIAGVCVAKFARNSSHRSNRLVLSTHVDSTSARALNTVTPQFNGKKNNHATSGVSGLQRVLETRRNITSPSSAAIGARLQKQKQQKR